MAIAAPERTATAPASSAVESDIKAKLKYQFGKVRRCIRRQHGVLQLDRSTDVPSSSLFMETRLHGDCEGLLGTVMPYVT